MCFVIIARNIKGGEIYFVSGLQRFPSVLTVCVSRPVVRQNTIAQGRRQDSCSLYGGQEAEGRSD